MSKLTLAGVRPTTPMRCPASCAILVIFGAAFLPVLLPLAFAAGGTHSTATFLRSVATALRIFRHVEVAANDGEIDLAVGQRLGARGGAIGLHRVQTDMAVGLGKGLRQRLDHLEVIAVGRTDRDPQDHRPHRKIIAGRERADDGEHPRQRDEHHLPLRPSGGWRPRRPDKVEAFGHRSGKQSLEVSIVIGLPMTFRPTL